MSLASFVPGHVSAFAKIRQQHLFDMQFQKMDAAGATGYSFRGSEWYSVVLCLGGLGIFRIKNIMLLFSNEHSFCSNVRLHRDESESMDA